MRVPMPAIEPKLDDGERARFAPIPALRGVVPVLLFHQVCPVACTDEQDYGIARSELAKIFAMLRLAGMTTLSIADYARFARGAPNGLPERPILLTFDDSRADAWIWGDAILADARARATMYVITDRAEANEPDHMSWSEISAAASTGRWDMQLHAHAGHASVRVATEAGGSPRMRHAYAWRRVEDAADDASGRLESLGAWRRRVLGDLGAGDALLSAHVPAYVSLTFAVPFSDYGQIASNDDRIAPELRRVFDSRFVAWFSQPGPDPDFTAPGPRREKSRFVVYRTTTAEEIYRWLAMHAAR